MTPLWQPFADELGRWRDAGLEARLWLRDDDAVEPTPALDRLIAATARHGVPIGLAVVPARAEMTLTQKLSKAPHVTPLVHGWSHDNHAPPEEKKQELGLHRPLLQILAELAVALARMRALFGERLLPVLVPPWNRIAPEIVLELASLGFTGLSSFGPGPSYASLPVIDTHVDLIDWRETRKGRDHAALIADLVEQLRLAREAGGAPVGILTHHLVHDEGAWRFLDGLFAATADQRQCRWCTPGSLIRS